MDADLLKREDDEIDLAEVFYAILHKMGIILLVACLCAGAGFGYSSFIAHPIYEANAMLIVNSGDRGDYVTGDQITSSTKLVDTYSIIITSDTVMNEVYNRLDMQPKNNGITDITVKSVNNTQIMRVTVRATDALTALNVCGKITEVAPTVIVNAMNGGSAELISMASTTGKKVSPSITKYTAVGFAGGFLLVAAIVAFMTIINNKVKNENDIQNAGISLLGVIPFYELEK